MDTIEQLLNNIGLSKNRLAEFQEKRARLPAGAGERVGLTGHLKILGVDKDRIWTVCDDRNLITNTGFTLLASMWGGPVLPETYETIKPALIAVGTTAGTPAVSMTTLAMGAVPTWIDSTTTSFIGSPSINGCIFEMLIPNGEVSDPYNVGTPTLVEAGLFPANYSGSSTGAGGMIAYKTYDPITKSNTFSLLYQWSFTFTAYVA